MKRTEWLLGTWVVTRNQVNYGSPADGASQNT